MDISGRNKIAALYAFHPGNQWSCPTAFISSLKGLGYEVRDYNLYANGGLINPVTRQCNYTTEGMDQLYADYRSRNFVPDYVILFDYGTFDHPYLHKNMIPEAKWICESGDDPQSFKHNHKKTYKFDVVMTPDYQCYLTYLGMGQKALFLTHCADQSIFKKLPDIVEEFDCVSTCGDRGEVTNFLSARLGEKFNNQRYFYGEEHSKRLNMGKIVFQKSQYGEITRRIFEGIACGKMVLTDRLNDLYRLHEILIPDKDIVYYSSKEEAYEKVIFYSQNEEARLKIAKSGYEKIMQYHLYDNRAFELMRYVNTL